jgi:hypothetical protein
VTEKAKVRLEMGKEERAKAHHPTTEKEDTPRAVDTAIPTHVPSSRKKL